MEFVKLSNSFYYMKKSNTITCILYAKQPASTSDYLVYNMCGKWKKGWIKHSNLLYQTNSAIIAQAKMSLTEITHT